MKGKACSRCGEMRPYSEYAPHPQTLDGYQSVCRPCHREIDRERYQRRKLARVCVECGERIPISDDSVRCFSCMQIASEVSARMRENRRDTGFCVRCGQRRSQRGYAECKKCRAYMADWRDKQKEQS